MPADFSPPPVAQSSNDLPQLMQQAAAGQPMLDSLLTELQDRFGCPLVLPACLKGEARAGEKAVADYEGRNDRLLDLLRGAIVVDSLEQVQSIRHFLDTNCDVVRKKDKFKQPLPHGHRDMTFNIRLPNGHIAEVQVRLLEFHNIRHATHGLYEKLRSVDGADLDPEHKALKTQELMRELHQLHGDAIARFNARTPGEKLPLPAMAMPSPAYQAPVRKV